MQDIVKRLNAAKKQQKMTLKILSEKSGVTLGTVNKIMSGELKKIKPGNLSKLAAALNVSEDYLLGNGSNYSAGHDWLGLVKIACISPEVRVGDCAFNADKIVNAVKVAAARDVKIALLPELSVTGYCCGDLFFQHALRQEAINGMLEIARRLEEVDTVTIVGLPVADDSGKLYNAAAVLFRGEVLGIVPKTHLPNYNEFTEKRHFNEFDGVTRCITVQGKPIPFGTNIIFADKLRSEVRFAIEICEDVWVTNSPSIRHSAAGANAVFNLSASNETVVKGAYRKKMIEIQSGTCGIIYAYCSSSPSESTSSTVFSGHNIICENGELLAESKPFAECYAEAYADFDFIANERAKLDRSKKCGEYLTVNFDLAIEGGRRVYSPTPFVPADSAQLASVCGNALNILAHGLKKRIEHIKANKLVIGVSGGSDSALALLTSVKALKLLNRPASDIIGVTMPCFGTSERTLNNSVRLIQAVGAEVRKIDITASVTQHLKDIDHPLDKADVVYENAQARERTQVLMDIANGCNGLVIGTGDMSELALGWCTYNGDHMSMYGVNGSVPKTLVKALIRHVANSSGRELKNVLSDILDTPVSPELLPLSADKQIVQITEDAIGPYELHDYFLFMLIRKGFKPSKVFRLAELSFADKYPSKTIYECLTKFIRRFFSQQFKRSCSPDGVRLGSVDLSKTGLLMPSDACCDSWIADLERVRPCE